MKIGISSWAYAWNIKKVSDSDKPMDAFALLEKAHSLGVSVLQIADNLPLESLCMEDRQRFKERLTHYGIQLECGTQGIRPEKLIPFIQLAAYFGSPIVRTLLHDAQSCPSLSEAEQAIRDVLPYLQNAEITLAIENHDFFPVAALKQLVERINDPHVRICLDPVNNFAQGEGTAEVLQTLKDYTVNFHCKDYLVRRKPGGLGFDVEGTVAGEGLLDPHRFKKHLAHSPISYILELWTPWQGDIDSTRALEEQWVLQSVANLKKLL